MMILVGLGFLAMALFGAPLFAIIAGSTLLSFYLVEVDSQIVPIEIYRLTSSPVLLSIPLFTFAGCLLAESGTPKRIVALSRALLGWLPGGLAIMALITCALFTAFTGASGVTIIALGALLYPALKEDTYPENFNLGLITTSGSLGLLFPPSIPLILYGVVSGVRVDDLFVAGIFPGLLMIALLAAYSFRQGIVSRIPRTRPSLANITAAVRSAAWEIPLPIIVLGGIYSGFFAVSEAAAVVTFYALVVEVFIYREVRIRDLPKVLRNSMLLFGGILVILGASMASTNYLIFADVPTKLFEFVRAHIDSKVTFLIVLNLFLLALGCMLDIFSALVIVVPLIIPIAEGYGVDLVHLGIIFLANMQIGYCTPPIGMNLFIASYRFEKPVVQLYWATIPFLLILLFTVLVITYWPPLSLILLR